MSFKHLKSQNGISVVEYAILLVSIFLVALLSLKPLGQGEADVFNAVTIEASNAR